MTFMTVLLALFIERLPQQYRPKRQYRWFDLYCGSLSRTLFGRWPMISPWGAMLALLPPLLLIAWLQVFFAELGSLFALPFGVAVLLFSLGPRELGEAAQDFIAARDVGEHQRADSVAQAFCLSEVPKTEPRRSFAVARSVVILAARRLIAPIFWFVVFGAVGAAAYRAIQLLAEHLQREECPQEMKPYSDEMRHMADCHCRRQPRGGPVLRRKTASVLLLLLLIAPGAQALEVYDDLGGKVSLPRPAQRIVTLSPHATELVLAAGAGHQLVGIADGGLVPETLDRLPRIGGRGGLDREALMALRPDLVIAWHSGNRASDLDWIDATGIALYRSEPAALQDVTRTIRDIGTLAGTHPSAETGASTFERALQTPCIQLPPKPAYVIVWDHPAMTVGGRHWINAVLRAAGYQNVLGHINRGVFHIAPEAVLGYSMLAQISLKRSFDRGEADQLADLLSRPGPTLGEAIQMLCARRMRYSPDYSN